MVVGNRAIKGTFGDKGLFHEYRNDDAVNPVRDEMWVENGKVPIFLTPRLKDIFCQFFRTDNLNNRPTQQGQWTIGPKKNHCLKSLP